MRASVIFPHIFVISHVFELRPPAPAQSSPSSHTPSPSLQDLIQSAISFSTPPYCTTLFLFAHHHYRPSPPLLHHGPQQAFLPPTPCLPALGTSVHRPFVTLDPLRTPPPSPPSFSLSPPTCSPTSLPTTPPSSRSTTSPPPPARAPSSIQRGSQGPSLLGRAVLPDPYAVPKPAPYPTLAGGPSREHAGATRAEPPKGTLILASHPSPPPPSPPRAVHSCPHPQGFLRAPRGAARALAFLAEPCSPTPKSTQSSPANLLPPPPPGPPPSRVELHTSQNLRPLSGNISLPTPTYTRTTEAAAHPQYSHPTGGPPHTNPPQAAKSLPQGSVESHGGDDTSVEGSTGGATSGRPQLPALGHNLKILSPTRSPTPCHH
ncbi:unnamed protein product [Closterium sp. Naga37s-1]|nr:unnamed protein product [Closterium sp. Naga37s-1]